jgi:hypothetical protein
MSQTIITAGDASAGLVSSAGNDGTLVLQSGAAGSKVNALSFAADGTPTLIKQPVVPAQSMVRVNTANGYGSTNTVVRKFTNVTNGVNGAVIQGTDVTLANDAALGASFTVNTNGVYAIAWNDQLSASSFMAITLNDTAIGTASSMLSAGSNSAANFPGSVSWTGYLAAGSVIRCVVGSSPASGTSTTYVQFTMTRVA